MAIIYGNAISIGYATSGSSVGGTYSIWLTIPAVATSTTFTAVKDGVSVASTYITSIKAAKITLPADNPEGDWTISGTVGGKTASKTVNVKSGTVDYFIDFRNDFIPLSGELKVGNLVTFDNKSWRVVHQEGTHWYLASEKIVSQTPFGSNKVYKGSTIAGVASTYESGQLSDTAKEYCADVTVENVTAKVFIPTYVQCNGGFEYYSSDANRICNYNDAASYWWTSSPDGSYVYRVGTDGTIGYSDPSNGLGFRPHICIKYYPNGFDFTYTGTCNIRDDGVVELLTSGDFTLSDKDYYDIFAVGGGGGGYSRYAASTAYLGGGGSGYTGTKRNILLDINNPYSCIIGAGGNKYTTPSDGMVKTGGDTSFGDIITVSGGYTFSASGTNYDGGNGGSGGGAGGLKKPSIGTGGLDGSDGNSGYQSIGGKGQGSTTREFGEATGKLYAGGGGAGGSTTPLSGGAGGGGSGAVSGSSSTNATPGKPNTGSGGGGGANHSSGASYSGSGAAGGSGIICIRKAKPQSTAIPLTGDLVVGNSVIFDSKPWRVVHNDGTKWYLALSNIIEKTQYDTSSATYSKSILFNKCISYLSNFSELAQKYMVDITVNNVTAKVFVPSREQLNGGFSYYNNNTNRICQYNGDNKDWWSSSSAASSQVYRVRADGTFYSTSYSDIYGFRPHICIDTSLSG